MGFYDAFFGSDQSLYTAYAIIAAIIAICITILLTATDVSVGNRILIVLFVIVTLLPSIFLTLFELTCIVTGGTEPNRWWCYAFAWVLAAFIIIYCIFIVVISLISLFTYNSAIDNINDEEARNKLPAETSNNVAKEIITTQEVKQKEIEKFFNVPILTSYPGSTQGSDSSTANMDDSNYRNFIVPPPSQVNSQSGPAGPASAAPPSKPSPEDVTAYFTNNNQPPPPPASQPPQSSQPPPPPATRSLFTNHSSVESFEGFGQSSIGSFLSDGINATVGKLYSSVAANSPL